MYDVAVLGKALDILEVLIEKKTAGLTQLSACTEINKATVFRILSTFESRGYVSKDPETRKYRAGAKLIAMSSTLMSGLDLVQGARPILATILDEFGETVNLGVLHEGHILYLDMLESSRGLRTAAHVGSRDHMYSTALGRAILSWLPGDEAMRLLTDQPRPKLTSRTTVDLRTLQRIFAEIRDRGYAVDDEENEIGARCIGAAVLDTEARPVAAVSVSGPASRLDDELVERIGGRLCQAARAIERAMGVDIGRADATG